MKLTIQNIERIRGAGGYDSPVINAIMDLGTEYRMDIEWGGLEWVVSFI